MSFDFLDLNTRSAILKDIKSEENKQRKANSLKQFEIYQDRLYQYVVEYLRQQFSANTVREMPVVSSINLARRITQEEASLYKRKPERSFNVDDDSAEHEQIEKHYDDMSIDAKMLKSNQYFKLQQQSLLMVLPKEGKLKMRVLLPHHFDCVPDPNDPENAVAYIISSFDKSLYLEMNDSDQTVNNPTGFQSMTVPRWPSDKVNQKTADQDDYKSTLERYVFWSKDYNFIMDGKGHIVSGEDVESPLASLQMMPFVDIAEDKDFEYFVRQGNSITDFTIQFCGALSDLGNVVKMQGWGQSWMSGSADIMPEALQIGPNFVLRLPVDPNNQVETKFGFSNASPDVQGSIQYIEMLLSTFLTSRGSSPKIVSGKGESDNYSSGIERMLALIEKFDSSQSDMEVFRNAEEKIFEVVKAWNNTLIGTGVLEVSTKIGEDTNVEVSYSEPQAIQSRADQLDTLQKEIEMGLKSRVHAISEINGIDEEKARLMVEEIDGELSLVPEPNLDVEVVDGENQGTDT